MKDRFVLPKTNLCLGLAHATLSWQDKPVFHTLESENPIFLKIESSDYYKGLFSAAPMGRKNACTQAEETASPIPSLHT